MPVEAGLLAGLAGLGWLAGRWVAVPAWAAAAVLGPVAFALVGDALNVVYCGWRLRRPDRP